jgi:hypothetical protein
MEMQGRWKTQAHNTPTAGVLIAATTSRWPPRPPVHASMCLSQVASMAPPRVDSSMLIGDGGLDTTSSRRCLHVCPSAAALTSLLHTAVSLLYGWKRRSPRCVWPEARRRRSPPLIPLWRGMVWQCSGGREIERGSSCGWQPRSERIRLARERRDNVWDVVRGVMNFQES